MSYATDLELAQSIHTDNPGFRAIDIALAFVKAQRPDSRTGVSASELARIYADTSPVISREDAAKLRGVSVRRLANIQCEDKNLNACRIPRMKVCRYRRKQFLEWLERRF